MMAAQITFKDLVARPVAMATLNALTKQMERCVKSTDWIHVQTAPPIAQYLSARAKMVIAVLKMSVNHVYRCRMTLVVPRAPLRRTRHGRMRPTSLNTPCHQVHTNNFVAMRNLREHRCNFRWGWMARRPLSTSTCSNPLTIAQVKIPKV